MSLASEDSDKISPCQSSFKLQNDFSVNFQLYSNMSVMLGRVTLVHLCTVNLIGHRVLIFCAKTCSIFLPNMNIFSLVRQEKNYHLGHQSCQEEQTRS